VVDLVNTTGPDLGGAAAVQFVALGLQDRSPVPQQAARPLVSENSLPTSRVPRSFTPGLSLDVDECVQFILNNRVGVEIRSRAASPPGHVQPAV
jgi:hypothetical protein